MFAEQSVSKRFTDFADGDGGLPGNDASEGRIRARDAGGGAAGGPGAFAAAATGQHHAQQADSAHDRPGKPGADGTEHLGQGVGDPLGELLEPLFQGLLKQAI